jgi:cytoskeletal protein RodZ
MGSLSLPRPLLAALVGVVAFAAVWMVVLRPHPQTQSTAGSQPTPTATVSHPTAPASDTRTARGAAAQTKATSAGAHHAAAKPAHRSFKGHHTAGVTVLKGNRTAAAVNAALKSGKVLALLLYNPAGPDDRADLQALGLVPSHAGAVVKLAAPIAMVSKLAAVTANVQVTTSPTLLIVDRHHQATSITGFVDPLEYEQAVAAALAAGK